MIRTAAEYLAAMKRLDAGRKRIDGQRAILERSGMNPSEFKRAIDPALCFHLRLQEEVDSHIGIRTTR
jgi:hypothetical protein